MSDGAPSAYRAAARRCGGVATILPDRCVWPTGRRTPRRYARELPNTTLAVMAGPHPLPGIDNAGHVLDGYDYNLTDTMVHRFATRFGPSHAVVQSNGMSAHWFWTPPPGVLPTEIPYGAQALGACTGDISCQMIHPHINRPGCTALSEMNETLAHALT